MDVTGYNKACLFPILIFVKAIDMNGGASLVTSSSLGGFTNIESGSNLEKASGDKNTK